MNGSLVTLLEFGKHIKRRLLDFLVTSQASRAEEQGLELLLNMSIALFELPAKLMRLLSY
jgi:hypothetical protein